MRVRTCAHTHARTQCQKRGYWCKPNSKEGPRPTRGSVRAHTHNTHSGARSHVNTHTLTHTLTHVQQPSDAHVLNTDAAASAAKGRARPSVCASLCVRVRMGVLLSTIPDMYVCHLNIRVHLFFFTQVLWSRSPMKKPDAHQLARYPTASGLMTSIRLIPRWASRLPR